MTRFHALLLAGLTLFIVAYGQDALGISDCDDPICHAWQQTSDSTPIEGIEYQLDSPDLWVDLSACDNTAVASGCSALKPCQPVRRGSHATTSGLGSFLLYR